MAAYERYFALADHIGSRDETGAVEPLVHLTVPVARPTMVRDQIVVVRENASVKPIEEGSRIFRVTDPLIGEQIDVHVVATGFAVEITKPTKKQLASDVRESQDAIQQAGTTGEEE